MLIETQFKPFTTISKDGDGSTNGSLSPTHHFVRCSSQFFYSGGGYSTGGWGKKGDKILRGKEIKRGRRGRSNSQDAS